MKTIDILAKGNTYDIALYLDERGIPGTEQLFITGGILAYEEHDKLADNWQSFALQNGLLRRKGTRFNLADHLNAAEFLIRHPVMPVVVWSELTSDELNKLHDYSKNYEESDNLSKNATRISPAHWIWKLQMSQTIAYAQISFLQSIGRIHSAKAYIDEFSDQPQMRARYKKLFEEGSSRTHLGMVATASGAPSRLVNLLKQASPESWQVHLDANIKNPLLNLADVVCAMYGRFHSGTYQEPWEVIRMRHQSEGKRTLPGMGGDVTWMIRNGLEELYATETRL